MQLSNKLKTVHGELHREILGGTWKPGEKLPPEAELALRFGCGVGTVSKALALLAHEGLVQRRTRVGTCVAGNLEGPKKGATAGLAHLSPDSAGSLDAFAFIYPSAEHEGIRRTVHGFLDAAKAAGRRVLTLTGGTDYRKEIDFIGRLSEFIKGVVVYPLLPNPESHVEFSKILLSPRFPVVLTEVNLPGLGCPSVVVDGFHAGHAVTKYLVGKKARRIGFLSNYAWVPFMRDRYSGYRWALEEARLKEPSGGVLLESEMNPDFRDPQNEPTQLALKFLQNADKLDAVVAANDFLALGCLKAAQQLKIRVPGDLLIIGIDDFSFAAEAPVPLTTYRIPYEEMGTRAFTELDAIVQSGGKIGRRETQVRGQLVVRRSA